jgi:hypothetical protein
MMKTFKIRIILYDPDSSEFLGEGTFLLRNAAYGFKAEDSKGWAKEILRRTRYFALPERLGCTSSEEK